LAGVGGNLIARSGRVTGFRAKRGRDLGSVGKGEREVREE